VLIIAGMIRSGHGRKLIFSVEKSLDSAIKVERAGAVSLTEAPQECTIT
jgi:hypothetical protein